MDAPLAITIAVNRMAHIARKSWREPSDIAEATTAWHPQRIG